MSATKGGGLTSWLTTTDHKRIGLLYFWTAFVFFLIGGLEALIIRAQLARPGNTVVSAETFNQLFTMQDRKSTRLNSSHRCISYAVFCLKKKNNNKKTNEQTHN